MQKSKLFLVSFTVVMVIMLAAGVIFNQLAAAKKSQKSPSATLKGTFPLLNQSSAAPSAVPFVELTIPYLRSRSYVSSLGKLEQVATNANYTLYLTSYTSDGLRINGLLTQPRGVKPAGGWPAIVFIHGYIPPQQYQTQARYTDHVDFLARNGFVVFKIDLRGHGNSQGESSGGYYSSDYVIDTLNAHAALAASDFVHPQKIGLWGHSMAGNVIFRSLAAKTDIPAIVIWAGAGYTYADLREFGIDDNSYQPPPSASESQRKRRELFEKHGQFDPNNPFWQQVVPTNYLSEIKGAVQLNHAVDDPVVGVAYSRNLNQILDGTTIPHELKEYTSGGHNITGSSFTVAMQNTVAFFKKYLGAN